MKTNLSAQDQHSPHSNRSAALWPALVAAAITLVYLGTTAWLPLLGKDEPRYVQVAREMWLRGDWVTPTLNGSTWFEKPALLYWLIIAGFHAFGVSEWSARLGAALCGLGSIALVYWVGSRVERKSSSRHLAGVCALAMSTTAGMVGFAHVATFDIALTATITLALACYFVAEIETVPAKRRWLLAGLWVGVGLSLLAKGLVGIILPGGIIGLYLVARRDWRGLIRLGMLWGLPLALAVSAIWYWPVIAINGQPFIEEFFLKHHFARYFTNKYQHPQPFYFYLQVIFTLALPWSIFLLAALARCRPAMLKSDEAQDKLSAFALAWLIVPVAFFSISGSKLFGYVMPALPGAVLLASINLAAYVRGETRLWAARATGGLLSLAGAGLALYLQRANALSPAEMAVVVIPLIATGIFLLLAPTHRRLCLTLVVAAMLLVTCLATNFGVGISERKNVRGLLQLADQRGYGQEKVWQFNTLQRTAQFYAAGRLIYDAAGEPHDIKDITELRSILPSQGAVLLLAPQADADTIKQSTLLNAQELGRNGSLAILRVQRVANGG